MPNPKPDKSLAPRACTVCGKEFAPYRASHRTCSPLCRSRQPHIKAADRERWATKPEYRERKNQARRVAVNPAAKVKNLRSNLRQYGVTLEWYEAKLAEQGGRCAICGRTPPPDGIKAASRLHVDHCHDSSRVRDLLCNRCNLGVGHFADDPALLEAAAAYLRRHQQEGTPCS